MVNRFLKTVLFAVAIVSILMLAESILAANSQTRFVFGCGPGETSFTNLYQRKILTEAFRRNGIEVEFRVIPHLDEITRMVNAGELDGDVHRASSLTDGGYNPGYVRIDPSTFTIEWSAYSIAPAEVYDWNSLARLGLPVGYRTGNHICETNLKGLVPDNLLRGYRTKEAIFDALAAGEIAIAVVCNQYQTRKMLMGSRYSKTGIHPIAVLAKNDMHAYVARKHEKLALKISKTLEGMQREGVFEVYIEELMGR